MCLGLPGRIVSVQQDSAVGQVEVAGIVRLIDLSLLRGPLLPGEHVLIHSGIALERMSADQACEAMTLFAPPDLLGEDVAQDQRLPG
jgi:hydrogenase expression/formation protein HypC